MAPGSSPPWPGSSTIIGRRLGRVGVGVLMVGVVVVGGVVRTGGVCTWALAWVVPSLFTLPRL